MGKMAVNDALEQLADALDRAGEDHLDRLRSLLEAHGASPREIEEALREFRASHEEHHAKVMAKARRFAEHPDVASPEAN
jgi:SOS response regulatory protein OraA/RecX